VNKKLFSYELKTINDLTHSRAQTKAADPKVNWKIVDSVTKNVWLFLFFMTFSSTTAKADKINKKWPMCVATTTARGHVLGQSIRIINTNANCTQKHKLTTRKPVEHRWTLFRKTPSLHTNNSVPFSLNTIILLISYIVTARGHFFNTR